MVKLVFLFLQGAVFGWIWETVYCTVKNKKWANRGFLYGPIVPIYGFGLLLAFSVYTLEERGAIPFLPVWTVFAAAFFISMVLEYFTSLLLEKLFHARWWDYSNMPLNIGGRTGVLTSLGFGAAGVPALRLAVPFLLRVYGEISFPLLEVFSFLAVMLLSADITLTVSALTDFAARVAKMDASFRDAMEELVDGVYGKQKTFSRRAVDRVARFDYAAGRQKTGVFKKCRPKKAKGKG